MAPERPVCDQHVRDRVTSDLGTTFLLEAGAGTGKTRVLVDRYVRCVLDPERGSGDVRAVAAITFTEKAAGELRQRIREEFERLAVEAPAGSERAGRIEKALDALDDAHVSTIHSFAARLLREFPVEAGIDPAFEQLDQLGGELERARLWEEWLSGLAAGAADEAGPRAWLARLLRAGVKLDALRTLAVGARGVFGERYDVDPTVVQPGEPDLAAGLAGLRAPLDGLRHFCAAACGDHGDRGFGAAMDTVEACERLLAQPPADLDQLAAALFALPLKATAGALGGAKGNWDAAKGGKEELWRRYEPVATGVAALLDDYAEFLTGTAVAVADTFSRWAGATQLALGRLDFTDLLGCLRDLLARDRSARGSLQRRFRYVLVDEFQDTDPLQAEIVFLLCEHEPLADDWRDVVLEPGKLFVVGDPKQSIYRFRRADITMYDEVKALVDGQPAGAGAVLAISQNFRTTPAVAAWVNNVFADVFDSDYEPGRQPAYQWVEPYRPPAGGAKVAVLRGREYTGAAGEADAARRDEARAVAALLVAMRGDDARGWLIQDRDTDQGTRGGAAADPPAADPPVRHASASDAEPHRPPRWGDIALLYRTTTGLETLEDALRAAGVPYRVEGGTTYFARREVDDALLCLRAADDPSDGPALYGALHSTLFGFSDDDLFLFWAHGGRFDLFADQEVAGHEAIVAAMGALLWLHERRVEREPHELIADLVRLTRATEFLAATGAGAEQAIANLDKLVERARAFAGAGGGGLGAFLAWAAEAGDAAGEQESQVDDDGDVVHLLTIHKAKGLEFPIVVLVGAAQDGGGGGGEPIVDRAARRVVVRLNVALPGAAERALEPHTYAALRDREKTMAASETRRLLYVATTRARDRLVVSCFGEVTKKDGSPRGVTLGPIAHALPAPAEDGGEYEEGGVLVLSPREPPSRAESDAAPDAAPLVAARGAWLRDRQAFLTEGCRPAPATSPSGLERVDDAVRTGGPGAPPGRASALVLGAAVHRVMELCDLDDDATIGRLAAGVTDDLGHPDLAEEAAALAGACWRAAPVRAAAQAAALDPTAVHRELPVGFLVGDGAGGGDGSVGTDRATRGTAPGIVVTGAVDLLYRDGEAWIVVDYKTDRGADAGTLLDRYRPQGAAYAVGVEAATGRRVKEVCFVAARGDGADDSRAAVVTVAVDDELRALARREAVAAAGAGRAVAPDELAPA